MPRPLPNFNDYEYLFKNVNYIAPDKEKFNVNTKIIITCNIGHEYCSSITKIKSLKQNIEECPHCKKEMEMCAECETKTTTKRKSQKRQ
jgi:hypothetical protein